MVDNEYELPPSMTMKEMESLVYGKEKKTSTKKGKQAKIPTDKSKALVAPVNPKLIYQTVHFYVRPGDSIQSVRSSAKDEAQFRNSNVIVIAHSHDFTEECSEFCKEITKTE